MEERESRHERWGGSRKEFSEAEAECENLGTLLRARPPFDLP